MTKINDFCVLYLLPDQICDTLFTDRCGFNSCPKHNLQGDFVDGLVDNDEKVGFPTQFRTRAQKPYPI